MKDYYGKEENIFKPSVSEEVSEEAKNKPNKPISEEDIT